MDQTQNPFTSYKNNLQSRFSKPEDAYKSLDTNNKGNLEIDQIKKELKDQLKIEDEQIAKNIFDELDADKDGKITQDEFQKIWNQQQQQESESESKEKTQNQNKTKEELAQLWQNPDKSLINSSKLLNSLWQDPNKINDDFTASANTILNVVYQSEKFRQSNKISTEPQYLPQHDSRGYSPKQRNLEFDLNIRNPFRDIRDSRTNLLKNPLPTVSIQSCKRFDPILLEQQYSPKQEEVEEQLFTFHSNRKVSFIEGTVDVGKVSPNRLGITPFTLTHDDSKKHLNQAKIHRMFGKNNQYLPLKTTQKIKEDLNHHMRMVGLGDQSKKNFIPQSPSENQNLFDELSGVQGIFQSPKQSTTNLGQSKSPLSILNLKQVSTPKVEHSTIMKRPDQYKQEIKSSFRKGAQEQNIKSDRVSLAEQSFQHSSLKLVHEKCNYHLSNRGKQKPIQQKYGTPPTSTFLVKKILDF